MSATQGGGRVASWQVLGSGQFAAEAAEYIPITSGRRHLVRRLTDKLAATASN